MNKHKIAYWFLILGCIGWVKSVKAQQKGLLWEISGNQLKEKSYLYGTMHVQDERVFNFPNSFRQAFDSTKTFAMELDLEKASNPANAMSLMKYVMMTDGRTLSDLVSKKDYKVLDKFFTEQGTPLAMMGMMKPFFLLAIVEKAKPKPEGTKTEALDQYLASLAKNVDKPIIGLETVEEQMSAIEVIPIEDQAKQLVNAVKSAKKMKKENQTEDELMKYYLAGDLDKLMEISKKGELSELAQQKLIVNRNINMADRIDQHIKEKSAFVAIGALHLPGEKGVIKLLEQKGYTLKSLP